MIRTSGPEDSPSISALAKQLGYDATAEQIAQRLRYFVASAEHNVFVAEAEGGVVIGWIGMYVARSMTSDARLEISGLVVSEGYRSRGVGALLLTCAEEWAAARGLDEVGVHANLIRERAHRFYERNGYRLEKSQKFFRKRLSEAN